MCFLAEVTVARLRERGEKRVNAGRCCTSVVVVGEGRIFFSKGFQAVPARLSGKR
jgi:hypothetical protein